ncbi:fatty acyl-CoA synthetase [Saxibacter everestensis]|uniref:Fatty acyl-CoA synthetase n=1 Tax=Saxibacter everestensis TaxID=2909229 RepID=A0ABY8QWP5_9MICO|nr:fatty acyl-CoA synthetase [Brevibacteriaceae bacterium ZFBP1038]
MDMRGSVIGDLLQRSSERHPGKTAIHFDDRSWTFLELDRAVSAVAVRLLEAGIAPGDRVAAYGKNSDAYLIGFLACARAGVIHVPVNFQLSGDELRYLIQQSGAAAVLVDDELRGNVESVAGPESLRLFSLSGQEDSVLDWAENGRSDEPIDNSLFNVSDGDVAQLLYTSGTTAAPKGAVMTHRALIHQYVSSVISLNLDTDDSPLHALPLYHSAQMHVFLMPYLAVGATSRILTGPDPATVLATIEEQGIDSFFAAPTVWVAIANHEELSSRNLDSLRKAFYGASIMPGPVLSRLQQRLPQLGFYNCFGQSEMGPLCTVLTPADHAAHPESAGRPVFFVSIRVVDADGNDVADGEAGEILYRSPQLCEGYWEKPDETAEAFRDGWFHSGDLVRRDEAGYITVVDRVKDVINTGGVMVASRQVEDVIYELDGVAEAAVVGVPDEKWIEAITAFVVTKGELTGDQVISHVKDRLAGFKVPKRVEIVGSLPRNASGKILKRQLRDA